MSPVMSRFPSEKLDVQKVHAGNDVDLVKEGSPVPICSQIHSVAVASGVY